MDAPKCKICGERHYGLCSQPRGRNAPTQAQPPELVRTVPAAGVAAGETAPNRQLTVEELGGPFCGIIAHETTQLATPKFDRVAYQREYMRKRRKALKDGNTADHRRT
jgi:hypothetical protein